MVCDACGRDRDELFKTRITLEGSKGMYADLCSECKKPVEKVLAAVVAQRGPGRTSIADLPMVNPDDEKAPERAAKAPRRRRNG